MSSGEQFKLVLRNVLANAVHHLGLSPLIQGKEDLSWRILMYHRIIDPELSPYPLQPGMYIRPETFSMQMKFLASNANVVPLNDLAEMVVANKTIPERTVAVTFDDGWQDIYINAYPYIREYKLPVTIFLPTSYVGTNEIFWSDKAALAVAALWTDKHQSAICARLKEVGNIDVELFRTISALITKQERNSRKEGLDHLIEKLKTIPLKNRVQIVNTLLTLAKEFTSIRPNRMFLNWEEVHEMAKNGCTFGSHSHYHQNLSQLSEAQLNDEIHNSFHQLHAHDIEPSTVFCYPGGDYSQLSQKVLAEKKIKYAVTTEKEPHLDQTPALLGRIAIHEDISHTPALFDSRIWASAVF